MSNLDFSGLKDITKAGPEGPKGWQPLTPEVLGYGVGLCFDQSLTATGCLILSHVYPATAPTVYSATKWVDRWKNEPNTKSMVTTLRRGVDVFTQAREVLRSLPFAVDWVAHESPPSPGRVKGGGTSSLLASQALWCACVAEGFCEPEMIGAQSGKKLVCGNGNAEKAAAHAVLRETVLPWIVNSQQVTNEATRDALMVGLMKLARTPR